VAHRYWCGECGFKTPWLARPEGLHRQVEHYARKHPGTPPAGLLETRRRGPSSAGCLLLTAVAFILLSLAASCCH